MGALFVPITLNRSLRKDNSSNANRPLVFSFGVTIGDKHRIFTIVSKIDCPCFIHRMSDLFRFVNDSLCFVASVVKYRAHVIHLAKWK